MYKEPSEDRKEYLRELYRISSLLSPDESREITLNVMIYLPPEERTYYSNLLLDIQAIQ